LIKYKVFSLLPGFDTNTYLVWEEESGQAMLIDPAMPSEAVLDFIIKTGLVVKYIINTHGHADHIGGNGFFREKLQAPVCIHSDDAEMLIDAKANLSMYLDVELALPAADRILQDNDKLSLGSQDITVIHSPGHTRGGICLCYGPYLFSGDTLFQRDIGRTDLPGGSASLLINSIKSKLFILPEETIVLPGHGPASTILDEKQNNPYI
jgi:hydroxyacylglutathione hydrolase